RYRTVTGVQTCALPISDTVEHDARDARELIDDMGEQFPAHIRGRLQRLEGAWTGRAEQVAAVGRFEIEAHRLDFGDRAALGRDEIGRASCSERAVMYSR